jgi:hypothetical protein
MVGVKVREQDRVEIDRHLRSHGGGAPADVQNAVAQDGIGEQTYAADLEHHGRVANERQSIDAGSRLSMRRWHEAMVAAGAVRRR